jgi:hypothetical protein
MFVMLLGKGLACPLIYGCPVIVKGGGNKAAWEKRGKEPTGKRKEW